MKITRLFQDMYIYIYILCENVFEIWANIIIDNFICDVGKEEMDRMKMTMTKLILNYL